jgi:hypothetical protein
MRKLFVILVAVVAVVVMSCAPSITVKQDSDKTANFASLKTFDWLPVPTTAVGSVKAAIERNSLLDKRVKTAVNEQLAAKGYTQSSDNPDVMVTYHVGVDDKINVTDWGYGYAGYGRYSGWGGGSSVDVYQYKEGTLLIDIIDAKTKQLIWRGAGTGTVDPDAPTEKREQRLSNAVAQIMANYPPK